MKKQVLFIQGAGEGAYEEDKLLANSLQRALGPDYEVNYPAMPDEGDAPYELWKQQFKKEVEANSAPVILAAHSLGASYLAKFLTETEIKKPVVGIFLLEAPYWGGKGWRYDGYKELELPKNTAAKFPKDARIFLYHTRDDEIVPFAHLALYAELLPQATLRKIDKGGHQLNNDLSMLSKDIKSS